MQRHITLTPVLPLLCLMLAGCATEASVYGLKPEYPIVRHNIINSEIAFEAVDSLQPALKWEPFPRPQDAALMGRLSNVTYDLQVWKTGEKDTPAELMYERKGIPAPFHKIERPLEPLTRHLWSIRARFELDGKPRVTEWGRPRHDIFRRQNVIPNLHFYRFETPVG